MMLRLRLQCSQRLVLRGEVRMRHICSASSFLCDRLQQQRKLVLTKSASRTSAMTLRDEDKQMMSSISGAKDQESIVCYSTDNSYRFRLMSRFGCVYVGIWIFYVASDALFINPTGAIASNAGIVGTIGLVSILGGAYLTRLLAHKTVGRLELLPSPKRSYEDKLRITTYNTFGSERQTVVDMLDVVPHSKPDDASRLKKFSVRPDLGHAFLILIEDEADILDNATFQRVITGVSLSSTTKQNNDRRGHSSSARRRQKKQDQKLRRQRLKREAV